MRYAYGTTAKRHRVNGYSAVKAYLRHDRVPIISQTAYQSAGSSDDRHTNAVSVKHFANVFLTDGFISQYRHISS